VTLLGRAGIGEVKRRVHEEASSHRKRGTARASVVSWNAVSGTLAFAPAAPDHGTSAPCSREGCVDVVAGRKTLGPLVHP
jgi:hypothetical protein